MHYQTIQELPKKYQDQVIKKTELKDTPMQFPTSLEGEFIGKSKRKPKRDINSQSDEKTPKKSKYGNKKTEVDNIIFDSKKEAKRYEYLMSELLLKNITNLRLQHEFTLQEAFTTQAGLRVQAIKYVADFTYYDSNGMFVVEDTKSEITRKNPVYRMKFKMMLDKKGIQVIEV